MSRHNRPCLLSKVTTQVKVKPAIFGLGAYAHEASPVVTGLQKPPAGSREGEKGEEEMVPVGKRLLIWAGASHFHTEDCATTEQLCASQVSFTESWRVFSKHRWKKRHFPFKSIYCFPSIGDPALCLKLTRLSRKMRMGEGGETPNRRNSSLQNLNY